MSAGTTFAAVVLLLGLGAAGVLFWLKQQHVVQREAFQALAARRGWSLTLAEQKLGRPAIVRLTSRSGTGWHCESRLDRGDNPRTRSSLLTIFSAEEPHWTEGSLMMTPALPQAKPETTPVARPQNSLATRVNPAVAAGLLAQLRSFPAPPGLTIQATLDPVHRFDLEALAKTIDDWGPQNQNSDAQPVIQIGPDGFRLQVGHGMRRADQMENFIDFALELIRVI